MIGRYRIADKIAFTATASSSTRPGEILRTFTRKMPSTAPSTDTPPSRKGYTMAAPSLGSVREPISMAPIRLTAYVSNTSAAIPAQSPTLSPTLSAMVAGLRGSSSSRWLSILPTRSAPTSAAFV